MPGLISVEEFVRETKDDFSSPITSTFASRMPQCKQTVLAAEEVLDDDKVILVKLKKTLKALAASGSSHIKNEELLCDYLEELGGRESQKEPESAVGPPLQKFAVLTRNMSSLLKTLLQHMTHNVCFPIDNLLKGDLRDIRGDVRRPFDRACKEYETKYAKLEKEKKAQAKEAGLIRNEVTPAELADELDKERKLFQLHMCEYLIRVNEIKTKKGVDLLEHLIAYYNAQVNYFEDGIKTLEQFRTFVQDLSGKLQKIRQKQDEERKQLVEIRNLIKSSPGLEVQNQSGVYHLHPVHNQANKSYGAMISGHLLKKSEGKVRKVWQRRRCEVRDGVLTIYHADESKVPTEVNLLTCHIKHVPEEKRCFDLISHNRTYHFQTEDDKDHERWISVLMNSKDGALQKAFDDNGRIGPKVNHSLVELQQAIIRFVKGLPGNDRCADCLSENDATWLSTNFGIIVCIECSGVHREMGVHVSRIQSLTLDHVAPSQLLVSYNMSNRAFNEVFEATRHIPKPPPESSMHSMEIRSEFIRAKYIEKRFTIRTCSDSNDLENDVRSAIINGDLHQLLQAYAEGADFCQPFTCQDEDSGETPLHFGVRLGTSLPVFDFIVENSKNLDVRTSDGLTPLHYCAKFDQPEHMKLLVRSGANIKAESSDRKTASHLAADLGHRDCKLLLDKLNGVKPYDTLTPSDKKLLLDNVVFHWSLSQEDGSTDFSEDETIVDTPVNENENTPILRTRQNVYGRISPRARSRSSTSESLPGSSPPAPLLRPDFGPASAPSSNVKKTADRQKRAAPNPPPTQLNRASEIYPLNTSSSTPHIGGHHRNQSDVGLHSLKSFGIKSPGNDMLRTKSTSAMSHSNLMTQSLYQPAISGGTLVLPRGDPPPLKPVNYLNLERPIEKPMTIPRPASLQKNADLQRSFSTVDNQNYQYQSLGGVTDPGRGGVVVVNTNPGVLNTGSLQRPKNPPPPTPVLSQRVNGKEIVPPERRNVEAEVRPKRCRALYDCEADNDDELSFEEGNIIVITSEKTEDENWMEGYLESSPSKKGVFPASFVTVLSR